jgi:hypothetical protein
MKKPSEAELVAMAIAFGVELEGFEPVLPTMPNALWKRMGGTVRARYRRKARAFLRALRGGR